MNYGFIKVASGRPNTFVGNTENNRIEICDSLEKADCLGVNLLVLPELCLTGKTVLDMLFSSLLINSVNNEIKNILKFSENKETVLIIGAPILVDGALYNCAVVIHKGKILGIVPKTELTAKEERYFAKGTEKDDIILCGQKVAFSNNILFSHKGLESFTFSVIIDGENKNNAGVIVADLSGKIKTVGSDQLCRLYANAYSLNNLCGYVCANAGENESTQDAVYSGFGIICEKGKILAENKSFSNKKLIVSEIDTGMLISERIKSSNNYSFNKKVTFEQPIKETRLTRKIRKNPFVPETKEEINNRAEEILSIQAHALKKRIAHTKAKSIVLGISGGLDSTLALLVAVRAIDLLNRSRTDIIAVTMPCFGTTNRTKTNAVSLCKELGVTLMEVDITKAVTQHFIDIGQNINNTDITYENGQARERTQVLMDISNRFGGFVVGTGDISELALGWATYNGDHMSMYGVNGGVPKTLIRHIVAFEAENSNETISKVLYDILDTPVSPELLPVGENGEIVQKTEDLVGPYELHDFFLYYMVRYGFSPAKIYKLARYALGSEYNNETIKHWLCVFTRRFFSQQFKRSCLPDGPKVGSVSLSPRTDLFLASDACSHIYIKEAENL